jgi:glycosyltransferase involved in cell wall biosynthesis
LNILQLGKGWFPEEPGGLNRYFYDCVHYLPKVGVNVHGLVAGSAHVAATSAGRVKAFAPSQSSLISRWRGVRQLLYNQLQESEIPLVVSHFGLYTFPVLNQLGDRPLVFHFHGPWALESQAEGSHWIATQVKKWVEQTCYQRAVTFIVLSNAFRDILHHNYGIPLDQIQVVPGGVDPDHFQTYLSQHDAREKLGWPGDRPTIIAVRRLAKRMGLENLLQAIAQVRLQHPEILLHIVGKGALQASLQAQIEDLGLVNHVCLLGYVPDTQLPLMYRAADFSVVPTVSLEGFGLIVIESLASGTPVLGTPIGGIPEILRPFSEDLVLDGYTAEHLAQGITDALTGERILPDATTCQTYIQQNFAWPMIAKRLQVIYQSAMEDSVL